MITFKQKGDFKKLDTFFERAKELLKFSLLDKYGRAGVSALAEMTPVDTGLTASSWEYRIDRSGDTARLVFYNTNIQNGVPIAIILQYGHATGNGGWVEGRDYINPAIRPIFDDILRHLQQEVGAL